MENCAVLVVDIINDFVTGVLGCDRARLVVEPAREFLRAARAKKIPVIFCNDAHLRGVDGELRLWGDHALAGTRGAEVIPELELCDRDYIVTKRRYSGFFGTDLDMLLRELGADTLIVLGLHAHLCVQHTVADAYMRGYRLLIPREGTNALTEEFYEEALTRFHDFYGAEVLPMAELLKRL